MTRFFHRAIEVSAWRYDANDFSERPEWLRDAVQSGTVKFDGLGAMVVKGRRGPILVKPGEWIVRDGSGVFGSFDNVSFEQTFVSSQQSYFADVGVFHSKFGLPTAATQRPQMLALDVLKFRSGFLLEELAEFFDAYGMVGPAATLRTASTTLKGMDADILTPGAPSMAKALDALADLVYVALGTAHLMGGPFEDVWAEVQRANMAKERATGADDPRSKRAHSLDVVKPEGWTAPNHDAAIRRAAERFPPPTQKAETAA